MRVTFRPHCDIKILSWVLRVTRCFVVLSTQHRWLVDTIRSRKSVPNLLQLSTTGINLTALSAENLAYINNTMDFLSVDPYTAQFATQPPGGIDACAANPNDPLWPNCVITTNVQANGWLNGDESYAYAYLTPQYFRQHMKYLWQTFRPKGILIAEFGFNPYMEYSRTLDAQRYDLERTLYYQEFLAEMLKVIYEDGVNIIGALGWSALDNNEFGSYMQ